MVNKLLRYLLIPSGLLLVWIFFVFWRRSDFGFFSITQIIDQNIRAPVGPIVQGQKINGSFRSEYNNMGLIAIRFDNFGRINDDRVIFRLRTAGLENWLHTVEVKTDQFQPKELFTFGFSVISDSRGKVFEFEVESVSGSINNAIGFHRSYPSAIAVYAYPRSDLMSWGSGWQFLVDKMTSQLKDLNSWKQTFVYLQPLVYYMVGLWLGRRGINTAKFKLISTVVLIVIFAINAVFLDSLDALSWIYFLILYMILAVVLRLGYSRSFALGFMAFLLAAAFSFWEPRGGTNIVSLGLVFLVVGFFQFLISKTVNVKGEPEPE